jgi:hypothetical protein
LKATFLLNQKKSFTIIKSPDLTKKGRTYYIIYYNYFKDTNFDFDRFKYRSKGLTIYVDAYYIADDEICPICSSNSISSTEFERSYRHKLNLKKLIINKILYRPGKSNSSSISKLIKYGKVLSPLIMFPL